MRYTRMHKAVWYCLSPGHYSHISGGYIQKFTSKWYAHYNGQGSIQPTRAAAKKFVEDQVAKSSNKDGLVGAKDAQRTD